MRTSQGPKLYTRIYLPGERLHGQLAPCSTNSKGVPQPGFATHKGKRLPGRGYWLRLGRKAPVALGPDWVTAYVAYERGEIPEAPKRASVLPPPVAPLEEQTEAWLYTKRHPGHETNKLRPASLVKYEQEMREFRRFAEGQGIRRAQDVTRDHLLAYGAVRGGTHITQRNAMLTVAQFVAHATGKRLLVRGDAPRKDTPEPEEYSDAALEALLTRAERRDLWLLFARTGLRDSEVAHLEWQDIDFVRQEIIVRDHPHRGQQVKDKERRHLPLVPDLAVVLQPRRGAPGDLVFPAQNGGVERHYLRLLKQDAVRLGLNPAECYLHRFRSTFASRLLASGADMRSVTGWLGHSTFNLTLRHYVARRDATSEEARNVVMRAFQTGGAK